MSVQSLDSCHLIYHAGQFRLGMAAPVERFLSGRCHWLSESKGALLHDLPRTCRDDAETRGDF